MMVSNLVFLALLIIHTLNAFPSHHNPHDSHTARQPSAPLRATSLNFPDPSLILVDSTWYSFATRTRGNGVHIQIASSEDFVD